MPVRPSYYVIALDGDRDQTEDGGKAFFPIFSLAQCGTQAMPAMPHWYETHCAVKRLAPTTWPPAGLRRGGDGNNSRSRS
jgi:hypothetical protein